MLLTERIPAGDSALTTKASLQSHCITMLGLGDALGDDWKGVPANHAVGITGHIHACVKQEAAKHSGSALLSMAASSG